MSNSVEIMALNMTLTGPRIRLRPFVAEDIEALVRIPANVNAHSGMVNSDSGQRERCGGVDAMLRATNCRLRWFFSLLNPFVVCVCRFFGAWSLARRLFRVGRFGFSCDWLFSQRFPRDRQAVMVLHQPVKHCVRHRGVANPLVPVLNG